MSIRPTPSSIPIIRVPSEWLHASDISKCKGEPIQAMTSGKMLVSSKSRIVSLSAREIARTSRWLAWLIVSTFGILGLGGGGVRAATGSGNVFLQGDFVEVGIHPSGSFGTSVSPPAGFHARGGGGQLGFVADVGKDGWSVGTPNYIGDYFVPGSPEEGWGVEWTSPGGGERTLGNFGLMGTVQIPATSLAETSSGNNRSAVWMGTATIGTESLQVTQTVHYNVNDLFFVISVTLVNTGTTTLNSVEYIRNVDPDQEQPLAGGSFTTSNYVVNDNTTGQRLVVGKGTTHNSILGLGTIDSRAVVSTEGFSNRDPDAILDSPVTPSSSSPIVSDQAISLAYRFGSLAPGQSVSFDYAYILKESDLAVALGNLAAVTILQPTGTVSGNSVIFQATTDSVETTTQMEFFINGTSIGIDTTPDAGGVFERTFDSTGYANGTLNLKVVATFASGSTVEKSATVTVGNSGPPISFATPLAGSAFGGSGIPVSINVLDVNHPPVTVNFFRETASTGSVSLGQDSSAPFGTTFSVTDLPAGEGVIIKAVAADNLNRLTTIQVAGVVATREIAVSGNGVDIATGDTTPSLSDHTDFGSTLAVSGSFARTFTITNSGEATLNLTGTPIVALSGPGASAFSVTTQPDVPTVAAGGGTRNFQITFHPATVATFVATVSIANDDADENPFTFGITGTGLNSAPTDINLTPGSIAENSGVDATVGTLSTSDSNAEDSFTYSLVDGVGSSDNAGFTIMGSTLTIKASPDYETKNGYSIRLRSTDQDGLFFEKQFTVTVTNVNEQPTVTSNTSTLTVNEGSPASNTGTFGDPDGNPTVALTASVGSISQNNATGTWIWSYTPADGPDATQTVTITGNDGVNTPVTTTFALTVNNIAPTALAQAVATNEDTSRLITLGANDPGADTQTFSIVTGPAPAEGTLSAITGNQVTFTPALNFNGSASFTFKATDSDAAESNVAMVSITVDAINDTPVVARDNPTVTINEGSLATTTGIFSDPEGNDTTTVTASVGTITQNNTTGTWSWNYLPDDGPAGPATVTITATDSGLPALVSATTFELTVNNVAPTIALTGNSSVSQSTSYTLNLGTITDPGTDIVAGYSIAWGDGITENFSGSPASTSKTHIYSTTGSKTINVTLTDEDGTFAAAGTKTISVVNDSPTVTRDNASRTANEGSLVTNTGTYTDVQGAGTVTLTSSVGTIVAMPDTHLRTDTTTGGKWRTSSVAKPLDIDGNNVYGTDGYSMWGLNGVQTEVNPSYATVTRNAALSFYPGNGGYSGIDNPLNPGGSQQLTGVLYNGPGGTNATTFFTITFTQARNVRMGILVDNADYAEISPSTLRLRQTAGGTKDSGYLVAGTPVSRNRSVDYYFFDIQAQAGDVYEVSGNNDPGFSSNGVGGVFFDTGTATSSWTWSYTPADGPDASQTVTISADDGVNPVVTTTFALTVNNVAPTALAQSVSTNEDTAKLITLVANDPGADTQTFSIVNGPTPAQGTISALSGNQVTFTPAPNYNGSASFTFKAMDSDGADSNTATVSITVDAVNDQPVVVRDNGTVTVNEGSLATNTGSFSDPEGNATTSITASVGTITQNNEAGTWSWNYTPADGPDASQTVTITATDNGSPALISTTTFSLDVNNVAPTALAQSVSTNEDTAKLITLGANDPGADTQTFSIVNGPTPAQGTLSTVNGNQVTFTPAPNYNGSASFTFKTTDSDGADSNTATVSITVDSVNDQPVVVRDNGTVTVNEGSLATNTGTFSDDDGNSTTTVTASVGTVTQDNEAGTWSWSYTPADGPDVSQTVTITATDNGSPALISTTTFSLDVNNVAPTALAQSVSTNEDTTKLITLGANDPGADTQSYSIVTGPTTEQGTLSTVTGDQVTFTPTLNFNGNASFTFKATDSDGADSNTTTVTIVVDSVNDHPIVAREDTMVTVNEGSLATNTGTFSDADGNATATLTASIGTLTQNNTAGTWAWTYTPADGPDDSQTVTITATDNGSPPLVSTTTFTLTVNNVAPTAIAQSITTEEDTSKLITLDVIDPGSDTQTFSIVTGPTVAQGTLSTITGNQVTFTPALNFHGDASFTFKATDSDTAESNVATVSITVEPINDPPVVASDMPMVIADEGSLASTSGTFADTEGNATVTLTATVGSISQSNADGTWSWSHTPADGLDDSQTVTITATDSGDPALVSTTTFALTVNNVAPTAYAQSVMTAEDTAKSITLGAADPGQDTLTFSIVTGPTEAQGSLSMVNGNQVTFTPALNFNGDASFTFKATDSDGAPSNTALVSIAVSSSNDAPSFVPGSSLSIPSGSALQQVSWATDITAGADDESEQALGFIVTNDNNTIFAVQPSINAEGVLTYQPAFAAGVIAKVTVTLKETAEGGLSSPPQTFTISMTGDRGTGAFETMATFANTAAGPKGPIVRDAYGSLWGTTAMGGLANQGTIWKLNATGDFHTVAELGNAASFNAKKGGGLVRGFDGNFYITATGDAAGLGSVLRMSPDGALRSVQTSTGSHTAAAAVLGSDGFLYGGNKTSLIKLAPTGGIVWSVKLPANTVLRYPLLEWLDGNFYGTSVLGGTSNLGVVFKVSRTGQYTVVKNLTAALGSKPSGSLITGHDGAMYGVTSTGGANGTGTVFRITSTGNHRIVASFPAGGGNPGNIVFGGDGCYYGTRLSGTYGAIYKMTTSGVLSTLVTFTGSVGIAPGVVTADTVESLTYGQDGVLYGATGLGGLASGGVLYSLTTTGTYSVLRHMAAAIHDPQGTLAEDSTGNHFGVNATGGTGKGSIFAVAPHGGVTDIHTFNGTDGSSPQSGLTLASDGNYYGTTSTGGTAGFGTLYRMTPEGVVTTLFSFTGTTGSYRGSTPLGPLTTGHGDSLYGTTSKGGSSNLGTVFRLTNLTGVPVYTVLANFIGKNGSTPVGGVAVDSDGKLFGTTRAGGAASRGCIYKIVGPDTGTPSLAVVASFTGTTGLVPGNNSQSTLIRGVDGKFYGTTRQGGASDAGTLFRISSAGVFELLTSFTNTSGIAIGKQPEGIVQGPDGQVYGTTALGGAAGFGVLFALDPTTKAYAVRKQFEGGFLGSQGRGLPLMGRDGNLYGLTATTVWRMTFAQQPTAKAHIASATTSTSATLNGSVNANGQNVTVQFEFGPTTDYGTTLSAVPASATGTAETPVSLPVTGLMPHTVYHYRLRVTAGANTVASADQTLTTLNTAPGAFSDAIVTNTAFNIVADELPDQDGDTLDIHSVAMPAAGTLARLSATNVQYTPTTTLTTQGYDQFIYHVGDGMDMSSPALLTVRYQPLTGLPPALPADAVFLPTNAEAYATWAISALPKTVVGGDRLPSGDADRDRISNALECLMGTNPIVSNASTFVIDTSGNPAFSKVRYTRQKGLVDGFETLEESPDGITWRAVDRTRLLMKRTNGTTTDTVETTIVPVPGTNALPYFRLSFSL